MHTQYLKPRILLAFIHIYIYIYIVASIKIIYFFECNIIILIT